MNPAGIIVLLYALLTMVGLPPDVKVMLTATAFGLRPHWQPVIGHIGEAIDRAMDVAERVEEWGRRHAGVVVVAIIMLMLIHRIGGSTTTNRLPASKPLLPPGAGEKGAMSGALSCMAMGLPRADLLTADEAAQLHCEMLAGHEVDINGVPESITKALVIVDTAGCARSMGNHRDHFRTGSLRAHEAKVAGAAGTFTTSECGELRLPVETVAHGLRMFREGDAILNPRAYVLLAIGRASIEQGVKLVMPPWGEAGAVTYPNGVAITVHNRQVLVLRPLGYKSGPLKSLAAVTPEEVGVPPDGPFVLYLGSGDRSATNLSHQLRAVGSEVSATMVDVKVGGRAHDLLCEDQL